MPVPIIWNNKCVLDFECELRLKSRFQIDLYTEGLNRVPKVYLNETFLWGETIKNGVLVIDKNTYFSKEQAVKDMFQNIECSGKFVKWMYYCFGDFEKECMNFEDKLSNKSVSLNDFNNYIDKLLNMMSLFAMQWMSFDLNILTKITKLKDNDLSQLFSQLAYEPYHIRNQKSYLRLLQNPTDENIESFINEYAFLDNFEIDKNQLEDQDYLRSKVMIDRLNISEFERIINHYAKNKHHNRLKGQKLVEELLSKCSSKEEYNIVFNNITLLRVVTDEEEQRHYLQARAVRNIRLLLEICQLDSYLSINEIKEALSNDH
jgi:hypothetical protein